MIDIPSGPESQSRDQKLARLYHAINEALTPCQRRVVIGHYIAGKSVTQLAREAGVCPSTVSRTLRRGELRLRYLMQF